MKQRRVRETTTSAYDEDLAYVHDVGFSGFARAAAPGVLSILRQAGIHSGPVVDFGCGGGIWARELAEAGYNVTGVDISPAMIAMARKRVPDAKFHVESYRTFQLPACSAVTSLGEPFNYLFDKRNGLDQLGRLFRRVHSAVAAGGLLIFDVAEPGRDDGRAPAFWEGDDWACLAHFETDSRKQQLTRRVVTFRQVGRLYRRSEELHRLQLYRGADVAAKLRKAGFRVRLVRSFGEYQLPRHLAGLIARKPHA